MDAERARSRSLLVAAGGYLEQYERDVTAVIAQEDYLQRVPVEAKFRRLRSDLLIVAEANVGWVEFRDTFEVDERPVRDRDNRAADLFLKPNPSALQQAKRIAGESARFNLSPQRYAFNRTLNVPLTALRFLRRPNQSRSTFQIDRRDATGVVVGFKETASPRLIASEDSAAASGSFTLDPESGRVLRTEFTLPSRRVSGTFTVEYRGAAGVEAVAAGGDGRTLRLSWGCGDGWAGDVLELPDVPRRDEDDHREVTRRALSNAAQGTSMRTGTTVVPQCSTSSAFFPSTIGK